MKKALVLIIKRQKMTQVQLAKELGITASYVSHLLAGRRRLGIQKALIASKKFGIPLERFFQ